MRNPSELKVSPAWLLPIALSLLICQFTRMPPNLRTVVPVLITAALLWLALRRSN